MFVKRDADGEGVGLEKTYGFSNISNRNPRQYSCWTSNKMSLSMILSPKQLKWTHRIPDVCVVCFRYRFRVDMPSPQFCLLLSKIMISKLQTSSVTVIYWQDLGKITNKDNFQHHKGDFSPRGFSLFTYLF